MITLRFYKNPPNILDVLIGKFTHGPYYHCAIVVAGTVFSSAPARGGVYAFAESLDSADYDAVDLPETLASTADIQNYYVLTKGLPYGYVDLVVNQVFNLELSDAKASFCSEWCANALKIPRAEIYNPNSLFDLVNYLSKIIQTSTVSSLPTTQDFLYHGNN